MAFIKQINLGSNSYALQKKQTFTIAKNAWDTTSKSTTITVNDLAADSMVFVNPTTTSVQDWNNSEIYLSKVETNKITLTCVGNIPTNANGVSIVVFWMEAA